ncbi:flagellar biosynthesis protein FliQ [Thalassospira sp.]|uniref:flagellar biosynthesis protein FliQ n=1 Tax=Thalassospira sp. TaxID=1912094 RepID=UPI00273403A9|nr:flagellar biosynthesis protein FliQ [Thalassospira sp.]MDP2696690.1 flagellar biosynthesis protein FliQ [Thalassospira sp.]
MGQAEIMDVAYDAIWTLLKVTTPLMLIALGVGLVIALMQALTQIQEMTLTFVPKILVIFIALLVLLPFMMTEMTELMNRMVDHFIGLPN